MTISSVSNSVVDFLKSQKFKDILWGVTIGVLSLYIYNKYVK